MRSRRAPSRPAPGRAPTLLDSFNYAFEGIIHVLRTQRNLRLHFLAAILVFAAAIALGVTRLQLVALVLAIAFVLVAEMLNTAIEGVIDVSTTSFDPNAKLAKDIAAGAVLIASITALGVGYLVFEDAAGTRTTRILDRLRNAPASLTLAALVLVVLLVIATKAWTGRGTPLARRAAVGTRGGRLRGVDRRDVPRRRPAPLHRLVARVHHGAARRADPRRVGDPHSARGRVRRRARGPCHARDLPSRLVSRILDEQKRYYAARAPEYDDWWYRRGRYELEPDALARWWDDVAEVDAALEAFAPCGRVLELAAGTGIWTRKLVSDWPIASSPSTRTPRRSPSTPTRRSIVSPTSSRFVPAETFDVVFFSFWLSHVPEERFDEFWLTRAGRPCAGRPRLPRRQRRGRHGPHRDRAGGRGGDPVARRTAAASAS